MAVSKLAAAAWVTSAAAVLSAATAGVYALAASNGSSSGTASAAKVAPSASPSPNGNSQGNNGNGVGNGGATGTQANAHPITVTGVVTGQPAPGRTATLNVTIDNAKNQAILIRTVTAAITSVTTGTLPGKVACNKNWFQVTSFAGSQRVEAGAKGIVPLTVSFTNDPAINQDNCKNQNYTFSYTATADQA